MRLAFHRSTAQPFHRSTILPTAYDCIGAGVAPPCDGVVASVVDCTGIAALVPAGRDGPTIFRRDFPPPPLDYRSKTCIAHLTSILRTWVGKTEIETSRPLYS